MNRRHEKGVLFEGMQNEEEKSIVEKTIALFPTILQGCFSTLQDKERTCACKDAMLRYKNEGKIGADWQAWLGEK